jgi:tRNA C32,U32 (ribose-2'-O)-methylase TrmJ
MDIAIVIGAEGKGIRPLVKKKCDRLFSIPMKGPLTSFNASVSGGMILYEVMRQRHVHDNPPSPAFSKVGTSRNDCRTDTRNRGGMLAPPLPTARQARSGPLACRQAGGFGN